MIRLIIITNESSQSSQPTVWKEKNIFLLLRRKNSNIEKEWGQHLQNPPCINHLITQDSVMSALRFELSWTCPNLKDLNKYSITKLNRKDHLRVMSQNFWFDQTFTFWIKSSKNNMWCTNWGMRLRKKPKLLLTAAWSFVAVCLNTSLPGLCCQQGTSRSSGHVCD